MEKALDDLGISMSHRPRTVITLELNPNVAFANALRFGRKHVRMTSADFRMQIKQNDVCGIERAILLEGHSVLSEFEKDNCIGLYLDYCGSPSKRTPFNELYMRLPKLVGCAITIAKRQPINHAFGCNKRRKLAAPPKDEFERLLEFDHDKVFCDMYVRRKKTQKPCDPIPKKKAMKAKPIEHGKATKSKQRKWAQRLIGNFVAIPETMWPGSNPGSEFEGVRRGKRQREERGRGRQRGRGRGRR